MFANESFLKTHQKAREFAEQLCQRPTNKHKTKRPKKGGVDQKGGIDDLLVIKGIHPLAASGGQLPTLVKRYMCFKCKTFFTLAEELQYHMVNKDCRTASDLT